MVDDDRSDDGPSIAPPTLGFGLRRRRKAQPDPEPVLKADPPVVEHEEPPGASVVETPAPEPAPPVVEQGGPPGPNVVETPAPEPATVEEPRAARPSTIFDVVRGAAPAPTAAATPQPVVVAEPEPEPAVVVPQPEPEPIVEREPEPIVVPEPEPEPDLEPEPTVLPPPEPEPEPEQDDATAFIPGLVEEPTQVMPVVQRPTAPAAPTPTVRTAPPARPTAPPTTASAPPTSPAQPAPRPPREKRELTAPTWLTGRLAAVVTGAIVGLVVVGSTALALQGCEVAQGTTSCGTGPGFLLLVVIVVLAVLAGTALLRLTGVPDGTGISVLGVALMVVIVLLFLLGSIFAWWMVIAVPLVCAATFALAHWTTVTFNDVDP